MVYTIVTISVDKAEKLVNLNKLTGLQNSIYLYIYCLGNVTVEATNPLSSDPRLLVALDQSTGIFLSHKRL